MNLSSDEDTLITILENYVLSSNKEAFLKTVVPNSAQHKILLTLHEMNTKVVDLGPESIKFIEEWKKMSPPVGSDAYPIYLRWLLQSLHAETNHAKVKEIIQRIDKIDSRELSRLQSFSKPVIFAAGDEFKEDKENQLKSELTEENAQNLFLKNYLKKIYDDPNELNTSATNLVYYHIDLAKIAKIDPNIVETILSRMTNYANLQVIPI
jgi:hypothetical protein